MPGWYSEADEMLEEAITKIANKNNLKWGFVLDSKAIEHGKDLILQSLVYISENTSGELSPEQLKDFKLMKKTIKKKSLTN